MQPFTRVAIVLTLVEVAIVAYAMRVLGDSFREALGRLTPMLLVWAVVLVVAFRRGWLEVS